MCTVMAGGGNTLCIPCISAWLHRQSASLSSFCASWIKSSTYNSSMCRNFAPCYLVMDVTAGIRKASGMVRSSNGCSGRFPCSSETYDAATFCSVSDAAQKIGGERTYPICRANGTTILVGLPGWFGNTYEKLHSWPLAHTICQKPSFMSILLSRISPPPTGANSSASISLRRNNPIWSIASIGAIFLVALVSDDRPGFLPTLARTKNPGWLYIFATCAVSLPVVIASVLGGGSS